MDGIIINKKTRFLKLYFKILFPAEEIIQWLSYGDENTLRYREFAYTTLDGSFKRYISFLNRDEMVKKFYTEVPAKIDISAIYNDRVYYSERTHLKPIKKELVFDIDLTDYDDVRICCSGTKICEKCWNYIAIACEILDASFREDWGFQNILWVYSGRRGIHVWICDEKIQWLNNSQRSGIADFFQLVKGNIFGKTRVRLKKLHNSIKRALKIIEPYFIPIIVVQQDMLGNKVRIDKFLDSLPIKDIKHNINALFEKYPTSLSRWEAFVNYFKTEIESMNEEWLEHRLFIEETILRYCYPRLDVSVTTGINHLLKLPYSVHPETGRIAIVLDANRISSFNPKTSPTVQSVWDEKISYSSNNTVENINLKEYEKTSLKESIDVFKKFLMNLEKNSSSVSQSSVEEKKIFKKINIHALFSY